MRLSRPLIIVTAAAPIILPLAAHATGIPFFGAIVPTAAQTCAAGFGALADIVNNLIAFAITIGIVFVAPLSIAYAGFLYVVNPVNPSSIGKAKKILLNTIVGIVIALAAWLIVDTVLTVLTAKGQGVDYWSGKLFGDGSSASCLPVKIEPTDLKQAANTTSANTTGSGANAACPADSTPSDNGRCLDTTANTYVPPVGSSCSSGTFDGDTGKCLDTSGNTTDPTVPTATIGGRGTQQCTDGNTNCSQSALTEGGLTSAQAAAMSCIAYSENGGRAVGASGTGPCGTFQLSKTLRTNYTSSGCTVDGTCTDASCNLQTAVSVVKANGYGAWTGGGSNPWNAAARTCVTTYDPNATNKGF